MKHKSIQKGYWLLFGDVLLILLSLALAYWLANSSLIPSFLSVANGFSVIGSLVAGLFFTSVFTTSLAIVALGEIAQTQSVWITALFGALGATVGDLLIFRFVKDRFSAHLMLVLKSKKRRGRARTMIDLRLFRWVSFVVGGLIIASPLPDELAIGLLGVSRLSQKTFLLISFVFNFIGILLIGLVARSML